MRRIVVAALVAVAVIVALATEPAIRFKARHAQAATLAKFTVFPPLNNQPLSLPFDVVVALQSVTFDVSKPYWTAYDMELSYDSSLLGVTVLPPSTLCQSASLNWSNTSVPGHVVAHCGSQTGVYAGVLETISFTCLADGTSALTLVPRPGVVGVGTALSYGTSDFDMTLISATVTCQTGAATPTPTATPTSTPTSTATLTPTVTPTPASTDTPTVTNTPLPPPPQLPVGGITDLEVRADASTNGTTRPRTSLLVGIAALAVLSGAGASAWYVRRKRAG